VLNADTFWLVIVNLRVRYDKKREENEGAALTFLEIAIEVF
jgi:hypothetical protein